MLAMVEPDESLCIPKVMGHWGGFLFPTDESEKKFRSVGLFLSSSVTLDSLEQNKLRPPRKGCGSA